MSKGAIAALAAAAALSVAGGASAAAFVNGSFEQPGGTPNRYVFDGDHLPGWTTGGGMQVYGSNGNDGIASAADGSWWVSFNHSGTTGGWLSQTFDTVAGLGYRVEYSLRQQQGWADGAAFQVSVSTGQTVTSQTPGSANWEEGAALNFIGTGSAVTLKFLDITPAATGGSANLALDNVRLTTVQAPVAGAVPEPATWAMMIGGFAMMGAVLRRRRTFVPV